MEKNGAGTLGYLLYFFVQYATWPVTIPLTCPHGTHKNYMRTAQTLLLCLAWLCALHSIQAQTFRDIHISTHRGARFIPGVPENSLQAFQYAQAHLKAPFLIECDVNMSSDSVLFLMHDSSLDRTTTGTGLVKNQPWEAIRKLKLIDDFGDTTAYRPPTFSEVLDLAEEGAFFSLDIKRGVPIARVVDSIVARGLTERAAVITYNPEAALAAFEASSEVWISVGIRNEAELQTYLDGPFEPSRLMAFTGLTARKASFYRLLDQAGLAIIVGTIGNLDQKAAAKGGKVYRKLKRKGAHILATDYPAAVQAALR